MTDTLTKTDQTYLLQLLRQMDRDKIPEILQPLWNPYRKKMIHGGRGSAKSETVCRIIIRQASNFKMKVLWVREVMESIKESLWAMLSELIPFLGYPGWVITDTYMENKITGSYFAFKGLKDIRAARAMKGYYGFDRLIVDEAESVIEDSWNMAIPTFRRPGSEIWAIFNRYEEFDPVYKLYCLNPGPDTLVIECNWRDNPWFPDELRKEMEEMRETDYDLYLHVYEDHPIAQLENAIIERALVDLATRTIFRADGPQVIGVDVARFGGDSICAYESRGAKVRKLLEEKKAKPIEIAQKLASLADNPYTVFNIDNSGLGGGGMIDTLEALGMKNVYGIDFGGTPKNEKKYANVATEMYFEFKDALPFLDIPDDPLLRQDLTGRLYKYDIKNRKIMEQKADFKKRYKRSPDNGDAIVLCKYDSGRKLNMGTDGKKKVREMVQKRIIRNRGRFIR